MSTYIKLSSIMPILELANTPEIWMDTIKELPSISFEEMINGYLQDIKDNLKKWTNTNLEFTDLIAQKYILEELLNKLP